MIKIRIHTPARKFSMIITIAVLFVLVFPVHLGSYHTSQAAPYDPPHPLYIPIVMQGDSTTPIHPAINGIWISSSEIQALPMSGSAWNGVLSAANSTIGVPDLSNQDDNTNVLVMAKALVYARTGDLKYRNEVVIALQRIAGSGTYNGRSLALGRELAAYVISADLIGYYDPAFVAKVRQLRNTPTTDGPTSLVDCNEKRPNNWGTHCGASRIAIDLYIGDTADLARAAQVLHGYLGDRSVYAGFEYGDVNSWVCDTSALRPINSIGCIKDGHDLSGAPVDDVRRGGGFMWPPNTTAYAWGGFSAAVVQAEMLQRVGYPTYEWENQAIKRGMTFLVTAMASSESGATHWLPYLVNHKYGTNFPVQPTGIGRLVSWTDWTTIH